MCLMIIINYQIFRYGHCITFYYDSVLWATYACI